jgi:endonuclease IV
MGENARCKSATSQDTINTEDTLIDILSSSEIRTHASRVWKGEDISSLRQREHEEAKKKKKNSVAFSPHVNYIDRAAVAGRRS